MAPVKALPADALYRHCDESALAFRTTAELEPIEEMVGQTRAADAVRFGIGIRREGYNLFVMGQPGIGKHTMVRQFLARQAAPEAAPGDLCYVNNFAEPHKPRALRLPSGMGVPLRDDMHQLIEELRGAIPAAFESEDYRTHQQAIEDAFKERHEKAFKDIQERAKSQNVALIRTPTGLVLGPMHGGKVLGSEDFRALPEEERNRLKLIMESLQEELEEILQRVPLWHKEQREKVKELDRQVTRYAVKHLIRDLREKYAELQVVLDYLTEVEHDVVENASDFLTDTGEAETGLPLPILRQMPKPSFRRYQVKVLVDNSKAEGAPVVYEDTPSYANLCGRIDHIAQLGALVTDFTQIKPGALHRANGGYLVIDARKLLMQPFAWEGLKRALYAGEIRIEALEKMLSLVSTVSLDPEPVPLDIKIVLVGERLLYYLLCAYDPDFNELFKVVADFEEDIPRDGGNTRIYARMIATLAEKEKLLPFNRSAVARVIEHSARLAQNAGRVSTHMRSITDLLCEADFLAGKEGRKTVTQADVQGAIEAQIHRASRMRERIEDEILENTLLIDTAGAVPGQINGLSVIQLGKHAFGRLSRITARVRMGRGRFMDIEREVKLGGPIHTKGVLILTGYIGGRYAKDLPLALSASLVFEQSYSGVEGDSASLAELCVLLSALAETPLRQSLAVTGSINQHGQVQAIGGVNEKIEGFFDLCKARGLTGDQGVVIPAANVRHLMLRHDVVAAVKKKRFHVYAVKTADEAIELLTGLRPGKPNRQGVFPKGSFNRLVEERLAEFAEKSRSFGEKGGNDAKARNAGNDAKAAKGGKAAKATRRR